MALDTAFLGQLNQDANKQLLQAQQKQALAKMLMQQALEPVQPSGGKYGIVSPLSGLAKALMIYKAPSMMEDANNDLADAQANVARAQMSGMGTLFKDPADQTPQAGQQPQQQPQQPADPSQPPSAAQQPRPQPQPQGSQNPALLARQLRAQGDQLQMFGMADAAKDRYARAGVMDGTGTDLGKQLLSQGVQPGSPQWQQAFGDAITKQNYIAPVEVKKETLALDPRSNKPLAYNPSVPLGAVPSFGPDGMPNKISMIPGASGAIQQAAEQENLGKTYGTPQSIQNGTQTVTGLGRTLFGPQGQPAPVVQGSPQPQGMPAPQQPQQPRGVYASAPIGTADTLATNQKDWQNVLTQHDASQKTISFLNNIKQLAPSAITGAGADKVALANNLLAFFGVGSAQDAKTASDLLDKNSNRIIAGLSASGMSTDAARNILAAANPNSHMSVAAIKEAADDLIGQHKMAQAYAQALAPAATANGGVGDPVAYNNTRVQFGKVADPRLWRVESMTPDEARAYLSKLPQSEVKSLMEKRQIAKANGWL